MSVVDPFGRTRQKCRHPAQRSSTGWLVAQAVAERDQEYFQLSPVGTVETPRTTRLRSSLALRRHYVEGRLDDTELSERLELVLQARSRRELRIALRQLPRWSDVEHLAERARRSVIRLASVRRRTSRPSSGTAPRQAAKLDPTAPRTRWRFPSCPGPRGSNRRRHR